MRRYAPITKSRGTVIPAAVRSAVLERDGRSCVGPRVGMTADCYGALELDHVRASGGIGMKSATDLGNLVALCSTHHREKTDHGRRWRPALLDYIAGRGVTLILDGDAA